MEDETNGDSNMANDMTEYGEEEYDLTEIDVLPESNIPRRTRYRKRRSPNVSIYTSHQSVNPFSNFGFTSTMSSCRDGPNFHECTTVTNNGGNRRNGQAGKKTVIVKVSLKLFYTYPYMASSFCLKY